MKRTIVVAALAAALLGATTALAEAPELSVTSTIYGEAFTNGYTTQKAEDNIGVQYSEDGAAVLRVADDGRGMSAEELAHIAEPFYRVDKARSRSEGGCRLGLALCSRIVRIHGAQLHFDSAPGQGTTVTVRFRAGHPPKKIPEILQLHDMLTCGV